MQRKIQSILFRPMFIFSAFWEICVQILGFCTTKQDEKDDWRLVWWHLKTLSRPKIHIYETHFLFLLLFFSPNKLQNEMTSLIHSKKTFTMRFYWDYLCSLFALHFQNLHHMHVFFPRRTKNLCFILNHKNAYL